MDKTTLISELTGLFSGMSEDTANEVQRGLNRMTEGAVSTLLDQFKRAKASSGDTLDVVLAEIIAARTTEPTQPLRVPELAEKLDLSVYAVNGSISILKKQGRVQSDKSMRFRGRQVIFLPEEDGPSILAGWKLAAAEQKAESREQKKQAKAE